MNSKKNTRQGSRKSVASLPLFQLVFLFVLLWFIAPQACQDILIAYSLRHGHLPLPHPVLSGCTVLVWLAVKRMRAGKPHRVFVWLARFFGVMVVMGVDSVCKAEGITLGGLVVVAGALIVLMIVSGVIRELGGRKDEA